MALTVLFADNTQKEAWASGIRWTIDALIAATPPQRHRLEVCRHDQLAERLPQLKPDVLVVNAPSSWRSLLSFRRLKAPIRLLVEHHYCEGFALHMQHRYGKPLARLEWMLRLSYRSFDRVVAVSRGQAEWMRRRSLVKAERLATVCTSREVHEFEALALPEPHAGPLVLGALGRFSEQKGFDLLLEAMRRLDPAQVQLRLGGGGDEEEALRRAAADLPHVSFSGVITDLPAFFAGIDALVVPSRWEPFGNVALEAKASGRPVLVTQVDGLTEQASGCGLIATAGPGELAGAIAQLIRCGPEQRRAWGEEGRRQAGLAWPTYVETWLQLLDDLEAGRSGMKQ
ncbi:glycosyltransferase family 1 protein [Synechococcus sp. RSCCF101]|uniref:glycosyltransferase family 4 protein n=1 Tax=Synechococcus sp. RSCCF101 TaxID=2511069 RepID=UPI001244BE04|nr:glycosyltransferase family 4 protein [Synechococcus sp. RSCCF101]QEY31473.1 glycosyltransferase family 1 protein [Synechococcus sp. RSCCF101]